MNMLHINKWLPTLVLMILPFSYLQAQDSASTEKPSLIVSVGYYNTNNQYPFVKVNTKTKVDGRFQPVSGIGIKVYMDSAGNEANLLGKFKSDDNGNVKAVLPAGLATAWKQSDKHSFIAVAEAGKKFDAAEETAEITKSKVTIDTLSEEGTKSLKVSMFTADNGTWVPLPGVEFKMGVARLGGSLPVSDEESFTTDSSGAATVEFTRLNLPGDAKGNLVLVVNVEDNEIIGNVSARTSVPWGVLPGNNALVLKRSLWGTSGQVPFWLLGTIITIIGLVWGTLFYLVYLFIKVRKLGKREEAVQSRRTKEQIRELVS